MNRSLQSKGSNLNRDAGNIHTSTIFLVIVIIIALASAGLVIWQVYYGQHHVAKNTSTTQSNEQSQSNKANETASQSNTSSQSTVQPDNSLAEHFNQICADPNQGIDQEMCSDINKQLRYDVARW